MKLTRCPICHSHLHLDALVQDAVGRKLLATVANLSFRVAPVLLNYIALFRPEKQDLSNDRALTLIEETLAFTSNQAVLTEALQDTVTSIQASRKTGQFKKLTNHNYLKKVLEAKVALLPAAPAHSTIEIKNAPILSPEENKRLWQEQMERYGHKPRD